MEIVINTFGVSLNRDNEAFVVTSKDGRQRIPVKGVTSIQMSRGTQVTSDAIMLAIENEIDFCFIDKSGEPIGRVWSPKYGSISSIRKGQLAFCYSHDAIVWIKDIICRKIENQQALLLMMESDNAKSMHEVKKTINRLEEYKSKIEHIEGNMVIDIAPNLRGLEGMASKIYFDAVNMFIPANLRFKERTQHPAMDATNAFLNYGYGVLYGKIEGALIKAGVDPYVGVLHRDNYNRPVLVYDVIEIYRIWVDYVVISIITQGVVTDEYYSIREDGSYWLENLGRRILIQSINDYLGEVVNIDNMKRSRATHIQLYAQSLAQKFKNIKIGG